MELKLGVIYDSDRVHANSMLTLFCQKITHETNTHFTQHTTLTKLTLFISSTFGQVTNEETKGKFIITVASSAGQREY